MALELLRVDPAAAIDPADTSDPAYFGYAAPGASDTDPVWSIKKRTTVSGVVQYQFPYITGTTMDNTYPAIQINSVNYMRPSDMIWDMRTGYTYR